MCVHPSNYVIPSNRSSRHHHNPIYKGVDTSLRSLSEIRYRSWDASAPASPSAVTLSSTFMLGGAVSWLAGGPASVTTEAGVGSMCM